jgi:RND family efflux transporter MFP subunit
MAKRSVGWWLLRIVALLTIGCLFGYVVHLRNQDQAEMTEAIRLPVVVARAEHATITRSFTIGSYVESEQIVTVTPKASGTLLALDVAVGDRVVENQLIAQVDPEPYQLAVEQATTALDAAAAALDRTRRLHAAGSASDAALDQAQAQFDAAETQLESATLNLDNTEVRSPVAGLVMARHRSAGEVVSAGVPIVTVSNTADLLVSAEIPETYVAHFVAGARPLAVRPHIPTLPGVSVGARVKFVTPYIRPESRTFEVGCQLTGNSRLVVPGMYVELEFVLEEHRDILTLPFDALVGGQTIWYLDVADSTAHSIPLEPSISSEERFAIPDEYADLWFIVDGQHFLSENLAVRVLNSSDIEADGDA